MKKTKSIRKNELAALYSTLWNLKTYIRIECHLKKIIMIRTNLIPQDTAIQIAVPQSYVGKKVEVLLYMLEEITETQKLPYILADLWGKLSDESAQALHPATTAAREEWNELT